MDNDDRRRRRWLSAAIIALVLLIFGAVLVSERGTHRSDTKVETTAAPTVTMVDTVVKVVTKPRASKALKKRTGRRVDKSQLRQRDFMADTVNLGRRQAPLHPQSGAGTPVR